MGKERKQNPGMQIVTALMPNAVFMSSLSGNTLCSPRILSFIVLDRVSLCSTCWPGTLYEDQAVFELTETLLLLVSKCWDIKAYKCSGICCAHDLGL